ncbi:MAG TPA: amidohydrolase family protein [Armatimonadota bacterium]|nr:amidohydrolase family protein [Armatimonadota bacterium]
MTYESDVYKRVHSEIGKIKIVDTHEHLSYPHELAAMGRIDFGRLFLHYASCDLRSAGLPADDLAQVQDMNSKWTVREKWQAIKPWYERTWNTAYCECLRVAMRDLYGIEDLADDTVEALSEKMDGVPRETWTRTVLDKAGIEIALEQNLTSELVYARRRYPDLFLYDMTDFFSRFDIGALSRDTAIDIYDLRDYLRVIDWYFDKFADEASAFKIPRAYDRPLFFDDVITSDAERVFNDLLKPNNQPAKKDIQALEDFIIHYCVRKAGEHNLPVKFHTGIQEGSGNDIRNSRAALLINLFMKYPKTKFDIYHISWPYTEELINICKNFPNVYIDFAWAWIFNPPASRRFLADMLETVPLNKIHGFGGDYVFVEGTYGHSVIARREIARVLADKVEEGRFSEEYALRAAELLLRENALENFRIEEKRRLYAERAKQE